jgi:simple sugar transport system permease protein
MNPGTPPSEHTVAAAEARTGFMTLSGIVARAGRAAPLWRALGAVAMAFAVTAGLILLAGKDPFQAYAYMFRGAFGSWDRVVVGLNKSTPYLLCAVGIALCFRGRVMNIGAEGQLALGGSAAAAVALGLSESPAWLVLPLALGAGAAGGALWAGIGAGIRVWRGVNEVLVTLLMNFIALLIVAELLHGPMGEEGAGFPQSPLFAPSAWLGKLVPGTDLHPGILIALLVALAAHVLLWRTTLGFRWRVAGASESAARYAGISPGRAVFSLMMSAGGLAGLAGAIECLGVHYRLIEGFSAGFGFNAVAVALMGALNPLYVVPSALFFGFLETGALAMQRQAGVPSSLVLIIQGLTMVFVLSGLGRAGSGKV